ncbi:MAG TPA: CHRD domain-containing protein [Phycisphaerales bacterium]|nr:CHRD domain-containing protein [Phycisphaerales bacterium]
MRQMLLTGVAVLAAAGSLASAEIIEWNFFMSGENEVPPNDSDATGAGQLLYNTDTQTFSMDIMIYGIDLADLAPVGPNGSPLHIHNAPVGENGPIVIDLGFISSFVQDGQGIRYRVTDHLFGGTMGGVSSDPDDNEAALFAGELYVNVHTHEFMGGELRGQLVPAPAALSTLALGLLAGARRRR